MKWDEIAKHAKGTKRKILYFFYVSIASDSSQYTELKFLTFPMFDRKPNTCAIVHWVVLVYFVAEDLCLCLIYIRYDNVTISI